MSPILPTAFWTCASVEDWDGEEPTGLGRAWRRLYARAAVELTLQPVGETVSLGLRLRDKRIDSKRGGVVAFHDFVQRRHDPGMAFFAAHGRLFLWRAADGDLVLNDGEGSVLRRASTPLADGAAHNLLFGTPGDLNDEGLASDWATIREGACAFELDSVGETADVLGPEASTLAGRLLADFAGGDTENGLGARLSRASRELVANVDNKIKQARAQYEAAMNARWRD